MSLTLEDLIRYLSDPATYPHRPSSVEVIQTHISVVFIAGELVYKIKKPINLGFLDFTTPERRAFYCTREVVLNSRFSHGIYLGVVPIVSTPQGFQLGGEGPHVDTAVLMRRIAPQHLFVHMLANDQVTPDILDRIADRIAACHRGAESGPHIASFGSQAVIRHNIEENFEQTLPFVSRVVDPWTYEQTRRLSLEFLASKEQLFQRRVQGGFIRDCHGDLHLDHVVIENGVMLIDCIEFNDRFRFGDTVSDLAFLLMDLEFSGYPSFSHRIARRYQQVSDDADLLELLPFYTSYRAYVRAKVWSFALDEPEMSESQKERAREKARDYFRFSLACLQPRRPVLVVMTGLTGTGKSFLAQKLGQRLGIEPVRSDVVRKERFGLPPIATQLDNHAAQLYTPSATELTYETLLERAEASLRQGDSVILDATFLRYKHRQAARELAKRFGAVFRLLQCVAVDEVIPSRLAQRRARGNDPSDGTWEVYCIQKKQYDPLRNEEQEDLRVWDSTTDVKKFLRLFVREVIMA